MAIDQPNIDLDKFPNNPDDRQVFLDRDGNQWVYDFQTDSWEFCGPKLNVSLADENETGLLSPQLKLLLDTVAQFPGAFGIVVDKPYKQVVQGNVRLTSNSLDISCLSSRGLVLGTETGCAEETTVSCSGDSNDITTLPRFDIRLKESYLEKLCIDLPAPKGRRGKQGEAGEDGENGFGDGPKGFTGAPGPDSSELLELRDIIFQDIPTISQTAIVDIQLVDRQQGPFFKVLTSDRSLAPNECAERILAPPIVRTLTFDGPLNNASCDITGLQDWTLNKISGDPLPDSPFLIRSSDDETEDCATVTGVALQQYIEGLVNLYEQTIVRLDKKWAKQAQTHIESIDAKARGILSDLANQLTRCESTLAGTEFGITFERCTPCSPAGPSALSVAEDNTVNSVQVSGKKWDIIS